MLPDAGWLSALGTLRPAVVGRDTIRLGNYRRDDGRGLQMTFLMKSSILRVDGRKRWALMREERVQLTS